MKALLDQRALLAQLVLPARPDILALLVTLVRGDLLVKLVYPELMASLVLLGPLSCCRSVLVRVVEIRALLFRHRKHKQQPSCLRLGWLSKDHLGQWDSQDVLDLWEVQEVLVIKEKVATLVLRAPEDNRV